MYEKGYLFADRQATGWQQQAVSENARQIAAEGKELYQRITPFFRHLNNLRHHIDQVAERGRYRPAILG